MVLDDVLFDKEIVRPVDDNVFRPANTIGALIPADAATALALRHGLMKTLTIEELRKLVNLVCFAWIWELSGFIGYPQGMLFQTAHVSPAMRLAPALHRGRQRAEMQRIRGCRRLSTSFVMAFVMAITTA